MHSVAQCAIADYLDTVLGSATEGFLYVAVGTEPYLTTAGKYKHRQWSEHPFTWPAERQLAVAEIARYALLADVYVCPYLMQTRQRAKGNVVARTLAHADVDTALNRSAVRDLGGFAVASGSVGHAQVYVPLSEPVDADVHEMLCRALARYLNGDEAKINDNDVLRPPGTLNYKPTLSGGEPATVRVLMPPTGVCIEPNTLAEQLGTVGSTAPTASHANHASEPCDFESYPPVAAAFHSASTDRSRDTFRIVAACFDAGLTLAQARWVVSQRADLAGRLNGRRDDDVSVCWLKIDTERRKARLTSIAPTAPIVLCVSKAETLEWLREYLESRGGCAHSADVVQDAAEAGISKRTLQRAAKGLEVVYGRTRERRSIWFSPQTAKCSANPLAPPSCGEVARNGAMLVSGISPNLEQSGASKLSEPDSETCRR